MLISHGNGEEKNRDCLSNESRTAFALASFFSQILFCFLSSPDDLAIPLIFIHVPHAHNSEVKTRKRLKGQKQF